ncbi:MAG: 50S ribosomal protein L28 [Phycisphaerae bacterium]
MPRVCPFTGKRTTTGRQITRRGKAKYLGGVGRKITGKTKRTFRANMQKVRAVIDGEVRRITVSTKAIRMGLITKPVRRDYVKPQAQAQGAAQAAPAPASPAAKA